MIQKDILYLNLINLIKTIVESEEIDVFSNTLVDEILEADFASLTIDGFKNEIKTLENCHNTGTLYSNYSILLNIIGLLETQFPAFNIERKNEILLFIALSKAISNQVTDVITDAPILVVNNYELICIDGVLPDIALKYFYYHNTVSFQDSILFLAIKDSKNLYDNIVNDQIDLLVLFITLSKIGVANQILSGNNYVLTRHGQSQYLNRVKSALLLHVVSEGKPIHNPDLHLTKPVNPWQSDIQVGKKYQQFFDTIYILSEYNYNTDILNKYLRLYQVFEDFMYKSSLVKLEKENNGDLFSIRDFKKMYEYVADREFDALYKLIESVFDEDYISPQKFNVYIHGEFRALVNLISQNDINSILKTFRIKNKKGNYTYDKIFVDNIDAVFSQLVYSIRNSIVHNKTTEFHLTYNTVDNNIALFIKRFMLPKMEILIFFLTIKSTADLVRFSNEELKIWKDD